MKGVIILLTLLTLSGCVRFREAQVEFVTKEELAAREAEIQCRHMARTLIQIARCNRR